MGICDSFGLEFYSFLNDLNYIGISDTSGISDTAALAASAAISAIRGNSGISCLG